MAEYDHVHIREFREDNLLDTVRCATSMNDADPSPFQLLDLFLAGCRGQIIHVPFTARRSQLHR